MTGTVGCRSPNDGRLLDRVALDGPAAIAEKLAWATAAYPALDAAPGARLELLTRFAERILAAKAELAALVVAEVGKTPAEAAGEVDYAAAFVTEAVRAARAGLLEPVRLRGHRLRPTGLGPALLIAPYNDPLAGITRKLAPAVAAGCPALVKPSPLGLLCARALLALLADIAPPGTAQLLLAPDAAMADVVAAPEIGVVSFTGSTATGRKVAAAAASGPKPLVLELGGNNAFLVDRDVELDRAVADLVGRKLRAAGQACSSVNRVHVHGEVAAAFVERLAVRTASLRTGPSTAAVDHGPVRTESLKDRLAGLHAGLLALPGARGFAARRSEACGLAVPFRWVTLPEGSPDPLLKEETFGPLLSVTPFADRTACLARIAAVRQNLAFYYYGQDRGFLGGYLARCRHGSVGFNTTAIQGPDVPTGGFGEAGYGREGGAWGVSAFLATLNLADPADGILAP